MKSYPIPFNEADREAALQALPGLREETSPLFDEIVAAVRDLLDVPTALVSLVEGDRQWFKARDGFDLAETPRDYSICAHTIMSPKALVVEDTHAEPRFAQHPVVVNAPFVRFYAGAPIVLSSGYRIGSLCALDYCPRSAPTERQLAVLHRLAAIVAQAFETGPYTAPAAPRQRSKEHEQFLALINHELRTPLTAILGYCRLLKTHGLSMKATSLVNGLHKATEHLSQLIENLLRLTDLNTREIGLNEEWLVAGEAVEGALRLSAPSAEAAGKVLAAELEALPDRLLIDGPQISAALSALIKNALVHGGGVVQIEGQTLSDGRTSITVWDNGAGFAAEASDLMGPFSVGEQVDTRSEGGLGLGLALAQKIANLHAGELTLHRDSDWTAAILTLPAWRGDAKAAEA